MEGGKSGQGFPRFYFHPIRQARSTAHFGAQSPAGWWGNPWGFESPLRRYRNTQRESGLTSGSPFREIGPWVSHDGSVNWEHFNLIFPDYLKLMTGFPSVYPEDVVAEFLQ